MRAVMYVALLAVLAAGTVAPASGTSLEAYLDPRADASPFKIDSRLGMIIKYQEGSSLSEFLDGRTRVLEVSASQEDPGVQQLMARLNDKIRSDGSGARVADLVVEYRFQLGANPYDAGISYKVVLTGNITNYTIATDRGEALVDLGWRGLGTDESIVIDGVDISIPLNVLRDHEPVVYDLVRNAERWEEHWLDVAGSPYHYIAMDGDGAEISSTRLIDLGPMLERPMAGWYLAGYPAPQEIVEFYRNSSLSDSRLLGRATWGSVFAGEFPPDDPPPHQVWKWTIGSNSAFDSFAWGAAVAETAHSNIPGEVSYYLMAHKAIDWANIYVLGATGLDTLYGVEVARVAADVPVSIPDGTAAPSDSGAGQDEDGTLAGMPDDTAAPGGPLDELVYAVITLVAGGGLIATFRHRAQKNRKKRQAPSRIPI